MEDADDPKAATVFPVELFDGERETAVGNVKLHPDLGFRQFQTMLSNMVGISYNNLTTYLVDKKKTKVSPERRKKILITGKVEFAVLVREKDCYFFVVLKRSRRDCRWKHGEEINLGFTLPPRFHRKQREKHASMLLSSSLNANFPRIEEVYPTVRPNRSLCADCMVAQKQGHTAEFHLCVYDEVIVGSLSSDAGPISQPRTLEQSPAISKMFIERTEGRRMI